jgi:carbon storage regulator
MLVLTRRIGEEIVIADNTRVVVLAINGQKVRLGINAPPSVVVLRQELVKEEARPGASLSFAQPRMNS